MNLKLYTNVSEKNCLGKTLINETDFQGVLREQSSIINPIIRVQSTELPDFNYAYVPDFKRYYFIVGIRNLSTNIWEISLGVDVLESFRNPIKQNVAIISDTESTNLTRYIEGEQWKVNVKNNTDIINFPNGLLENGEYILITAGG
nr:MAG TPA: hypothetical protein [Caudoviricetes sp.]